MDITLTMPSVLATTDYTQDGRGVVYRVVFRPGEIILWQRVARFKNAGAHRPGGPHFREMARLQEEALREYAGAEDPLALPRSVLGAGKSD